jgi:hypothetical protein
VPSPKSGSAGSAVSPQDPAEVDEADDADPGEVAELKAQQRQAKQGKYGSEKVKGEGNEEEAAGSSSSSASSGSSSGASDDGKPPKKKTGWIEIRLEDKDGKPVPGQAYRITLPDGTLAEGTLNDKGSARVDGFDPGSCKVTFPQLDRRAWKSK